MSKIKLTFPDDSVKEFDEGTTTLDVAKSISTSLGKKAVAGKLNDTLVDLERPIKQDAKIEIISGEDEEDAQKVLRNTAALVFAAAAKSFKKDLHIGEKQSNDDGFYVDTDNKDGQISVDELKDITALMNKIIKNNDKIERSLMDKSELVDMFKDDPYKSSLVGAIDSVQIPVYTLDGFVDFGYDAVLNNL